MSNKTQTCPTCGEIVDMGEMFCPSCGERLSDEAVEQSEPVLADNVDRSVTTGGRTNVMGDNIVNAQDQSTTNNIDNSQTTNTSTVHNVQNTSSSVTNQQTVGSIDNSQQVVNNITIIGGAGMTLPGGVSIPGGPQQAYPNHSGAPAAKGVPNHVGGGYEGGRAAAPSPKSGGYAFPIEKSSGGIGKYLGYAVVIAVAAIAFYVIRGGDDTPEAPQQEIQEPVEEVAPVQEVAPRRESAPRVQASRFVEEKKQETSPQVQAPAVDANYEAGMKAYNEGDGLEAVRKFQDSGTPQSLYMLGVIYEKGCGGVESNAMKARSFFKKAAAQGSADAKAKL